MMIEAKFWASLTANQPNAYLNLLPPSGALLFVAPTSGFEALWAELQRAVTTHSTNLVDRLDFESVRTGDQKHLMLTSWEHLLSSLEASVEIEVQIDIRQLRGLTVSAEKPHLYASSARRGHELDLEALMSDAAAGAATAGCVTPQT